jgi:hypothetical protein
MGHEGGGDVLNIQTGRPVGFIVCSRIGYGAYMAEVADFHHRRIESIFTRAKH